MKTAILPQHLREEIICNIPLGGGGYIRWSDLRVNGQGECFVNNTSSYVQCEEKIFMTDVTIFLHKREGGFLAFVDEVIKKGKRWPLGYLGQGMYTPILEIIEEPFSLELLEKKKKEWDIKEGEKRHE